MCADQKAKDEFELRKIEFEKSLQLRNFEIDNFWKRGWFFGALLIALGSGFVALGKGKEIYAIYIAFLGFLVSVFQTLMNRGSKYWQERWENKTKNRESALGVDVTLTKRFDEKEKYYIDAGILAKTENFLTMSRRFSVTKLTFLVWDVLAISWFWLWLSCCNFNLGGKPRWDCLIFHLVIISYISYFYFKGRVFERYSQSREYPSKNFRQPYYDDSENYYKNLEDKLTAKTEAGLKQGVGDTNPDA